MTSNLQDVVKTSSTPVRLTVPARDTVENPNVETNPAKLHQWVEQLPFAHPSRMAEALLTSLFQLNRFPGAVTKRSELMACYQLPFTSLYRLARKTSNSKASQTPGQQQANISALTIQITTELAYGYKLIINEMLEQRVKATNKPQFCNAIYSAINAITLEQMLEYSEFIPDSKTAWREIYQLYGLAEQYHLEHAIVEEETSISLLFKRILLIVLIDPYRLQLGEVWSCYEYLAHWAVKADLQQQAVVPKDITGVFLLDLQSMQPPKPPKPGQKLQPDRHRIFSVAPLNLIVHQHMRQIRNEEGSTPNGTAHIPPNEINQMFRHMLLAWHVRPTRRSERQEQYGTHLAAYGLSAVTNFLLQGSFCQNGQTANIGDTCEDTDQTLEERHSFRRENVHFEVHRWRIYNRSTSGVGIIIPPPFPTKLQVGQIILIEIDTNQQDKHLMPGTVRRIVERDTNTLEAGVQFIHGRVSPISIRPYNIDTSVTADFQHALALNPGGKASRTLLTPHGMYKRQQKFMLGFGGKTYLVQASKLAESTPIFDRFEYQEIILEK
ncbi:hypothetical protein MNBD_GAMMA26-2393 [hydrothermal vent metagenome]|uniref:PilZ domain-containing protein n=1 Tax=hydrothermal vent metagenome TaxID=652676 RepID=A0A3B1AX80_9ZZZZ